MEPRVLECPKCDIEVKGHFAATEFSRLDHDSLHFLRIFIHCDGKIRDIEKSLGISYPTVKARLAELKAHLGFFASDADMPVARTSGEEPIKLPRKTTNSVSEILTELKNGLISHEESLIAIKNIQTERN
jgi:hypothetical protein